MRYSKEREAIYNYISEYKTHPTAKEVHSALKNEYPSLSLGTVYRNLSQLESSGKVIRLNVNEDYDKFDATTELHYHLYCLKCKNIKDIILTDTSTNKIYENIGFKVVSHNLLFKGFCEKCLEEEI